jgi:flagellar hook protein FlgE
MSSTYYTSLTGMIAASYGLQNTSNNIANMQSSGFKRSDVFYSTLGNGNSRDGLGSGVTVGGHGTNFAAGKYLETGNPADMAVVGNGFFIVKLKTGELLYTRNGEFDFNTEGLLIDKHSGGLVQGYNKQGALIPISRFGPLTNCGQPTHTVQLKGEFIIRELEDTFPGVPNPDKTSSKYEHIKFDVEVFDTQGKKCQVSLEFEAPHDPAPMEQLHWNLIKATCPDADVKCDSQFIEFEDSSMGGLPKKGHNSIVLKLNDNQLITLNFGEFGKDSESSVRIYNKDNGLHANTQIEIKQQDGYSLGKQIGFAFDDNGQITYSYDNGKFEEGIHVALAMFDDLEHSLVFAQDNLYRAKDSHPPRIGRPNKQSFGTLQPKKLESSNVDSTTEFANIVVLQRMFQACSQIMDIDKQLLEELSKK